MLEIVRKYYSADDYFGCSYETRRLSQEDAIVLASQRAAGGPKKELETNAPCFTTLCYKSLFSSRHVPAIDIDGAEEYAFATKCLKEIHKVNYIEVESSPGHWWIFIDWSLPFKRAIDLVRTIGGRDEDHTILAKHYKRFLFRAFPKIRGNYPRFFGKMPNDPEVAKWYVELVNYFSSSGFESIKNYLPLEKEKLDNCEQKDTGKFSLPF